MAVQFLEKEIAFIAIDGSDHSTRAFNWYIENIHDKGDEVGLVHVHVPPQLQAVGAYGVGGVELYATLLQETMAESKALIVKYKDLCASKGIKCKPFAQTVNGSVGHTICEITKENNASLIVIGQRGLGKVRRTLFGSVSDYVLHHAHIPVMVVPVPQK